MCQVGDSETYSKFLSGVKQNLFFFRGRELEKLNAYLNLWILPFFKEVIVDKLNKIKVNSKMMCFKCDVIV